MNQQDMAKPTIKALIAFADSPYRVLDVPFDADVKAVNRAMRDLFRKDPRSGAVKGNRAQKQLTDVRERIKEDAFCVEVDLPQVDLAALEARLPAAPGTYRCLALEEPILFSDLHCCPDRLAPPPDPRSLPARIPYRPAYDQRGEPCTPEGGDPTERTP